MIAYIALGIAIFDLLLWVVFAIGIRKVFVKMLPLFQSFGIMQSQNLTYSSVYGKMGEPSQLTDAESEQ